MTQEQFYKNIQAYRALRKQAKYTSSLLSPQLSPVLPVLGGSVGGLSTLFQDDWQKEDAWRRLARRTILGTLMGGGLELGRVGGMNMLGEYKRHNSIDSGIKGVILPHKLQSYSNLFYFV